MFNFFKKKETLITFSHVFSVLSLHKIIMVIISPLLAPAEYAESTALEQIRKITSRILYQTSR